MHTLIAGEMKNRIKQVITYHSSGSRSMTVGRGGCTEIQGIAHMSDSQEMTSTYLSLDKDGNRLQHFENGNFAVEYFKPKVDVSSLEKSEFIKESKAKEEQI